MSTSNIAIIITTYKRQDLLRRLLESIAALEVGPCAVIVVDNENSPETRALANEFQDVRYVGMEENTGGAGGFSRGVHEAYERGYEWFWLMDDDVEVLPGAIEKLTRWTSRTEQDLAAGVALQDTVGAFQSFRRNFDGSFFYWQYQFMTGLGIQNPFAKAAFEDGEESKPMNAICFEGGLIHRSAVEACGLPDARFFIYSDDTVYGYCLSHCTRMLLIPDYTLARTRELDNMRVGKTRKLNTTSDMSRYYIMRNRGYIARYLMEYGDWHPVLFAFGTAYTLSKELIRLFVGPAAHGRRASIAALRRGMRDAKKIRRDAQWVPYREIHPLAPL